MINDLNNSKKIENNTGKAKKKIAGKIKKTNEKIVPTYQDL